MMNRILALLAVIAAALSIAACGNDDVPEGAVARVDDETIQRSTLDHWMKVAGQVGAQSGGQGAAPDPANNFASCVTAKRKAAPKPAKGQPRPDDALFRAECKREYDQLRDQVLSFLIAANWVEAEAADQGVKVSDAELDRAIEEVRKASFPKQADFERYLRQSGLTMADVRFQTRVEQLQTKLIDKINKGQREVSDEQIRRYYEQNKARFGQPERRDVEVVLTRTRKRAEQARRALDSGTSFRAVVRRFSEDDTTKGSGGKIEDVVRGQQLEKALDEAVFRAKEGEISGPVKTQFGHYVFRVTDVAEKQQQSLEQARGSIKQLLEQQAQQRALETFVKEYRDKWTDVTNCREGFIVDSFCGNAPKRPATQQAETGQPQPQPSQQAPER
jgi:foldase protein PrsA